MTSERKRPVARQIAVAIVDKAGYVLRQGQTRNHVCHWTGCSKQVPPAMWGCREHWFKLPKSLRDSIWKEYQPGQEKEGTPSARYLIVVALVEEWIAGRVRVLPDGRIETSETNEEFERRLADKIATSNAASTRANNGDKNA